MNNPLPALLAQLLHLPLHLRPQGAPALQQPDQNPIPINPPLYLFLNPLLPLLGYGQAEGEFGLHSFWVVAQLDLIEDRV